MSNTFNIHFEPIKSVASKLASEFDVLFQLKSPEKTKTVSRIPLNVNFSIDISGSMNEQAGKTPDKEIVTPGFWQLDFAKVNKEPMWPKMIPGVNPDYMMSRGHSIGGSYIKAPSWNNKPHRIDAPQNQCPGDEYSWIPEQRYKAYTTKLERVVDAVIEAIGQLQKTDRFSVVSFSSNSTVVVESGFATKTFKENAISALKNLRAGGGTALHDGWKLGAEQVCKHLESGFVNRVLLLTDGEANIGIKDSDTLASHTNGLAGHNVSTSTFGVGSSYNEDLLQTMSDAGDGQYYYLDEPESISLKFEEEFSGLSQLFAKSVKFELSTNTGEVILLNELVQKDGIWSLPNGINGLDQYMVLRIKLPATKGLKELSLNAKLYYKDLSDKDIVIKQTFNVPFATKKAFDTAIESANVATRALKLVAAKAKREAMAALDSGDYSKSRSLLEGASGMLSASAYSMSLCDETSALNGLVAMGDSGCDSKVLRKQALYESYSTTRSKS